MLGMVFNERQFDVDYETHIFFGNQLLFNIVKLYKLRF